MRKYRYVVEQKAVETLVEWPDGDLHQVTQAFSRLADNPNQKPDLELPGLGGRRVSLKRFGVLTVTYWEDAPVYEIRIVAVVQR